MWYRRRPETEPEWDNSRCRVCVQIFPSLSYYSSKMDPSRGKTFPLLTFSRYLCYPVPSLGSYCSEVHRRPLPCLSLRITVPLCHIRTSTVKDSFGETGRRLSVCLGTVSLSRLGSTEPDMIFPSPLPRPLTHPVDHSLLSHRIQEVSLQNPVIKRLNFLKCLVIVKFFYKF